MPAGSAHALCRFCHGADGFDDGSCDSLGIGTRQCIAAFVLALAAAAVGHKVNVDPGTLTRPLLWTRPDFCFCFEVTPTIHMWAVCPAFSLGVVTASNGIQACSFLVGTAALSYPDHGHGMVITSWLTLSSQFQSS